jgi:hypothetical protein
MPSRQPCGAMNQLESLAKRAGSHRSSNAGLVKKCHSDGKPRVQIAQEREPYLFTPFENHRSIQAAGFVLADPTLSALR